MANMILATPQISDAATLSSSAVAASLPLENLKESAIGKVTRFTTPAEAHIIVDLGASPKAIDLIALLGHNASVTGTAHVRAAANIGNLITEPDFDSGIIRLRSNLQAPAYQDVGSLTRNHFLLKLDAERQLRYWRIDLSDPALTYLDIGRLYLSRVFQPETNMDYGLNEGFIDPSTIQRTRAGRLIPNERPKYRYAEFTLSFGTEAEIFGHSYDIEALVGTSRDVLFINDYDNKPLLQKRSIYGRFGVLNPVISPFYKLFEKSYRIEEIIE